ncbi:2-oxoglutarate dehydrogenase complex dihydrolipoyllysine-residue succinyltransferase [Pasteurellaceae bacterium LIM206]|nr:2-oxoglutarate dehydrogenase complex dihydrolipoyllysine-residue succinyltransferase [Pasteurellaceae bacterium LIM206]
MSNFEILTPVLPESVADATVVKWHKAVGDLIERDEILVEIETDKVVLEVPALNSGVLVSIDQPEGATVVSNQLLGLVSTEVQSVAPVVQTENVPAPSSTDHHADSVGPAARRLLAAHDLTAQEVQGTGEGGRITSADVERVVAQKAAQANAPLQAVSPLESAVSNSRVLGHREEKRVPMTRLRKRIAERLLEAKNSTAMLTTFNEVDMQPIMALRKKYGEKFEKQHGTRLGFMSFYVKAVVEALKRYPVVNASIDGDDIIYHNYFDVSIAVSTPRGLVTPVIRNCDKLSMADIEKEIKVLAEKGRDGKLTVEDLTGGNFTITNGGVFGSLMSTPIINPPQAAILGMHAIKERPVAVDGQVVIRPMMYLALSYDHRLIDGRESVSFLVAIKELLEDPTRLLLEI